MEKLLDEKQKPALIAFYQALGVVLYISLVVCLMNTIFNYIKQPPEIVAAFTMLNLFVFSAAITGTLVFGLPVYFAFVKNNVKRAISLLAYTFLYLFVVVGVTISTLLILYSK